MGQTGFVVIDPATYEPVLIDSVATNDKQTHGERLHTIRQRIGDAMDGFPPKVAVIERGFQRFPTATQVQYRVHGVINHLFKDVKQIYYPPKKVKETILNGNATKKQVQEVIQKKYPHIRFSNEDESDAMAVALTYLILEKKIEWKKK